MSIGDNESDERMIFKTPQLETIDREVFVQILAAREQLKHTLSVPRRWNGLLRRSTMGRAMRGSNSIEGYHVEKQDVVAAAAGELVHADEETLKAIDGYRRAMTYVLQLAGDPHFRWSEHVVKSLHFMMLENSPEKSPGSWRFAPIYVYDEAKRGQVYEGPDFGVVPSLMHQLVETLSHPDESVPHLVLAAMAHLNLTMIHPFRDGNGRMARCLQTLVLGRSGTLEPPFSSIEEYLGVHQFPYYDVLAEVGQGGWHPENDALPFVRFCLRAHYYQAHTFLKRVREGEQLWNVLEQEAKRRKLPERMVLALWDAAQGFRVVNATYRMAAEISQPLASRDLTTLVNTGLLIPEGEKRARFYRASPQVLEARKGVQEADLIVNPYPPQLPNPPVPGLPHAESAPSRPTPSASATRLM
jgi:Fic family protein